MRARNKDTKALDSFPIIIVGGGGGTASILHYDVVQDIGAHNPFLPNHLSYRTFVNGESRTVDSDFGTVGTRGFRFNTCLLYTSPSPRDATLSRMPSSA